MRKARLAAMVTILLLGFAPEVWAGPAEDVLQIAGPRGQAFLSGNLEEWMAAFADNAVFHSAPSPFRIEGKAAIRAHFDWLFKTYPHRSAFVHQPTTRVYNDDLVIWSNYTSLHYADQKGTPTTYMTRQTITWAKVGGRWQIVDHHISRLPISP